MSEALTPTLEPPNLTGAQRRALRALGHHLEPVIHLGKGGLTDGLIKATRDALERHELVKVKLLPECPEDRKDAPAALAQATGAHVAQVIGRTSLLYRRRAEDPAIDLPGPAGDPPARQAPRPR